MRGHRSRLTPNAPDQRVLLEKCADQLHSAHGVLRLGRGVRRGAARRGNGARHALPADSGNDQKRQIDGLDALMRAMVQLPTYLERVLSGGRDLALVLLPLLNDLRSVRGSPLLSEGTLLLLNLKSDQPAQPQSPAAGRSVDHGGAMGPTPAAAIPDRPPGIHPRRTHRAESGNSGEGGEKLEQVATTQPVFQLWWVTGAILEAVRANGLEGSATLKRLLGKRTGRSRHCTNSARRVIARIRRSIC